jgi:hypothetical protein
VKEDSQKLHNILRKQNHRDKEQLVVARHKDVERAAFKAEGTGSLEAMGRCVPTVIVVT